MLLCLCLLQLASATVRRATVSSAVISVVRLLQTGKLLAHLGESTLGRARPLGATFSLCIGISPPEPRWPARRRPSVAGQDCVSTGDFLTKPPSAIARIFLLSADSTLDMCQLRHTRTIGFPPKVGRRQKRTRLEAIRKLRLIRFVEGGQMLWSDSKGWSCRGEQCIVRRGAAHSARTMRSAHWKPTRAPCVSQMRHTGASHSSRTLFVFCMPLRNSYALPMQPLLVRTSSMRRQRSVHSRQAGC